MLTTESPPSNLPAPQPAVGKDITEGPTGTLVHPGTELKKKIKNHSQWFKGQLDCKGRKSITNTRTSARWWGMARSLSRMRNAGEHHFVCSPSTLIAQVGEGFTCSTHLSEPWACCPCQCQLFPTVTLAHHNPGTPSSCPLELQLS